MPNIMQGKTDQEKFRNAASDGMSSAFGIKTQSPAPGAENFKGVGIRDLAHACARRAGLNPMSPAQTAKAVVKMSRQAMGTDDFSSIMQDVINKILLKSYTETPSTFWPLVRQVPANDFRTIYGVSLGEGPELELVSEHGEYPHGRLTDKAESYSVKKYGKIIEITWEAIVNDDSRALSRLPQLLGNAAARKESDIIWALITSNPVMNEDSKTLFHADHNNLESTALGVVDNDKLGAGRTALRTQAGPGGATLNLEARYLLVPSAQGTSAEVLLRSRAKPEANMSSGVYNPWQSLIPIEEPRLDQDSTKAWYLAADPAQIDIIELAYLGGNDEPTIEQQPEFTRDVIGFKVRHEFGAGIMDYRGLFKNPGE